MRHQKATYATWNRQKADFPINSINEFSGNAPPPLPPSPTSISLFPVVFFSSFPSPPQRAALAGGGGWGKCLTTANPCSSSSLHCRCLKAALSPSPPFSLSLSLYLSLSLSRCFLHDFYAKKTLKSKKADCWEAIFKKFTKFAFSVAPVCLLPCKHLSPSPYEDGESCCPRWEDQLWNLAATT